ncbi:MAG: hypothetical protein QM607_09005, partial [Microbacterium sp.]
MGHPALIPTVEESFVTQLPPRWIWRDDESYAPRNRFTWFRAEFTLDVEPAEATALIAADSTAYAFVNGIPVMKGMTRFTPSRIRAERLELGRALTPGRNVVLVLHHSWGDITTFQRTGAQRAGLWFSSSVVNSGTRWRWLDAEEFAAHEEQFLGLDGTPRIRYPVRWTLREERTVPALSRPDADADWRSVSLVESAPWPPSPLPLETPQRRWVDVRPARVLGAAPAGIDASGRGTISGNAGEEVRVVVAFERPLHGQPFVELESEVAGEISLEYAEI